VGIGGRIAQLSEVKVNAPLDRAEDPREVLDYPRARQQKLLLRICRACPAGRREQVPARTAR
jgi:hypothetical protein